MHDLSPEERLTRHRAVEAWLEYQLQQTRKAIAELEREAVEWERRRKIAHRESRFTIEYTPSDEEPDRLHRGGCRLNPNPGDYLEAPAAALEMREKGLTSCQLCKPILNLRGTWIPTVDDDGA